MSLISVQCHPSRVNRCRTTWPSSWVLVGEIVGWREDGADVRRHGGSWYELRGERVRIVGDGPPVALLKVQHLDHALRAAVHAAGDTRKPRRVGCLGIGAEPGELARQGRLTAIIVPTCSRPAGSAKHHFG